MQFYKGILAVVLVLQACVAPAEAPRPGTPAPEVAACGAAALQGLVGQSARVLETMRFGVVTRVIRPGMAVTMDYSPGRLNIRVNGQEVITHVECG